MPWYACKHVGIGDGMERKEGGSFEVWVGLSESMVSKEVCAVVRDGWEVRGLMEGEGWDPDGMRWDGMGCDDMRR